MVIYDVLERNHRDGNKIFHFRNSKLSVIFENGCDKNYLEYDHVYK